jgi:hypothetical protein
MSISINDFFEKMLGFFPLKRKEFELKMREDFEGLDTIIVEDILCQK